MVEQTKYAGNFKFPNPPSEADILKCTHCGLCLNQCPTYRVLGWEMDSPRGRVRLMRGVSEGLYEVTPSFADHMDVCLACRACQTACPASLNYGQMVEAARAQVLQTLPSKLQARFLRWLVLRQLFTHPGRLTALAALLRAYQRSGMQQLAHALHVIPRGLRDMETLLPKMPARSFATAQVFQAQGKTRGRVALLAGCVMGTVYAETDAATVRVLTRNGFQVVVPKDQLCCGAMAIHSGERALAQEMARKNIDAFLPGDYAAIIVNAAGCGLAMKEYKELLTGDPEYADKAKRFSTLVQDATEFLAAEGPLKPRREIHARITYQDPCHLAHGQNIRTQPRTLLKLISGLELVEMRDSDRCCGSAGIYNITHSDISLQILDEKMANVAATKPEIIVTANAGCLLQLQQGVRRAGLKAEVLHVMDLLDRAYS